MTRLLDGAILATFVSTEILACDKTATVDPERGASPRAASRSGSTCTEDPQPRDAVITGWAALSRRLQSPNRPVKLRIANRIFGESTYVFDAAFLDRTRDEPFKVAGGATKTTPMMHRDGSHLFGQIDGVKLLELRDGRRVRQGQGRLHGHRKPHRSARAPLCRQGVREGRREETEAAAATAAVMARRPNVSSRPALQLTADHPFLFVIMEKASGLVIFAGRVSDPTDGEKDL